MDTDAGQVAPLAGAPEDDDAPPLTPEERFRQDAVAGLLQELTGIANYLAPVRELERRRNDLYLILRDQFDVPNATIGAAADATPDAVRVAVSKERARRKLAAAREQAEQRAAARAAARAARSATP
jgi:hypothetical protein